jgi:ribosome-associated protein
LEKVITVVEERKSTIPRLNRNSKLFKQVIKAIHDKKGDEIMSLDLKKIDEAVADYFVLCEANSHIHMKAIADNIIDEIEKECGEKPFHKEYGESWTLVDYVNIVIHIFRQEQRAFYNLEGLWADAPRQQH